MPTPVIRYAAHIFMNVLVVRFCVIFFFFNDTATTEIYTLSLHDALPISCGSAASRLIKQYADDECSVDLHQADRKSTRLNSSHTVISYAVFCLKKKNQREDVRHRGVERSRRAPIRQ